MKFINGRDSVGVMARFVGSSTFRKTEPVRAIQLDQEVSVGTPEGNMQAHAGDYLVSDVGMTHCWPVKKEVFERTYEEVK